MGVEGEERRVEGRVGIRGRGGGLNMGVSFL